MVAFGLILFNKLAIQPADVRAEEAQLKALIFCCHICVSRRHSEVATG
jgi:hypothetical protein